MADPWTQIADAQRAVYAAHWLPHRCTVERPTGTGASATWTPVATDVACRFKSTSPQDWGLAPGAFTGRVVLEVRFAVGADVLQGDRVTPTVGATGARLMVRGVRPAGAYDPAYIVRAESGT